MCSKREEIALCAGRQMRSVAAAKAVGLIDARACRRYTSLYQPCSYSSALHTSSSFPLFIILVRIYYGGAFIRHNFYWLADE